MPSFRKFSYANRTVKPAVDFNCGWSAVHLLSALSLASSPVLAQKTNSMAAEVVKVPAKRANTRGDLSAHRYHEYS